MSEMTCNPAPKSGSPVADGRYLVTFTHNNGPEQTGFLHWQAGAWMTERIGWFLASDMGIKVLAWSDDIKPFAGGKYGRAA